MKSRYRMTAMLTVAAFVMLIPVFGHSKDAQQDAQKKEVKKENPWVLKKDKDGIKVFIRDVDGIEFKEFLGTAVFDTTVEKLDKIISDVPNQVNWMCDTIEAKLIKDHPVNPIQYNVITAPLVSNRDVVIQTRIVRTPGKCARYFQAIQLDSVPPKKGTVRMPKMIGLWIFESVGKNQTKVTYQNLADPGGSLPSGLVNMTVVKMPFVTLQGLRNQLKNPKYN